MFSDHIYHIHLVTNNESILPIFYLEDYDVYLDPKNDFLIPGDTIKINMVSEQTGKKIIILDKNQLSWDSIKIVLGIGFEPTMWS